MFKGDYLRVLTPETIDGVVPKTVNGRVVYKESHLPVTARKFIEKKNLKRPDHLKHQITLISANPVEEVADEEVITTAKRTRTE